MERKFAVRPGRTPKRTQEPPAGTSILDLDVSRNDWLTLPNLGGKQANDNAPSDPLEELHSLKHVSARWDVSMSTLYREIGQGALKAEKVRGQWRVSTQNLVAYRKRQTEDGYPRLFPKLS